ncbi:DegT/DnrJ/EryC1/StrS family aminotransferase [Paenibacillus eucommiae]|uniref:dTDP-4-amino-4,6-dideoxygalactose transaminase n=1 Tax=Paenibacillus eucommiae TaxID=1355755 RepID=A0ABS4ILG0_9BACL|nr:DegT/DnrJ/EryC1/StrS family aminotransferase [Paenibacillus eucommiae]MBP1988418.1 dTDP-4-amino-4,6-dideoxygalactose transaminase [Paenibacillus eucommiae]
MTSKLAIHGGDKVKTTPYGSGKRFGLEEAKELLEALEQNTLFYHFGNKVKTFLSNFNEMYGIQYSVATSSGTAAIHVALGACGISVGDEVITSPITDQGTLIGILYQNAIPVFADLEPHTYNLDPKSIEALITPRTKAIVVVHLAGNPCDMDAIMDIARRHGLKVVEDCAQSYLCKYKGRLAGTIGDFGCFSTNDFKHMSTGDGGIVTVNSGEEADYYITHAFADKNYQRFGSSVVRDLTHLAPNYRMTELQGAVGIAQLKKLNWICEQRNRFGDKLTAGIKDLAAIQPHQITEGGWSSYWFYLMRVDESKLSCSRDEFAQALAEEGISCSAGYIPQVVYMQPLFQKKQAYPNSSFPFELSDTEYSKGTSPVAEQILLTSIRLPINEFFTDQDIEDVIAGIRKVAAHYSV